MLSRARAGSPKLESVSEPALPEPRFDHLASLTTPLGLWEHADRARPRPEHGFCVDDNARALILLLRIGLDRGPLREMARVYMRFLQDAAIATGGFHNRRRADGTWADTIGSDDSQGRALWALGSGAHLSPVPATRKAALDLFQRQRFESPSPRANAFAVLGAGEVLQAHPDNTEARDSLRRWASHLHRGRSSDWPWPESRLAYQNARIPEAMIVAGDALGDDVMVEDGLSLLRWLVAVETRAGHFSFIPVGGWAPGEPRPGFDQQPTEAGAMADACARAWRATGDAFWLGQILQGARWLMGANDGGTVLYDSGTGGCYDGLTRDGPNLNQGAESTLAALTTLDQARRATGLIDSKPDGNTKAAAAVGLP